MTVFWLVAAMFVAGALLIVLPALWRFPVPTGAPPTAPPWRLALGLGIALPAASVALYLALGHPGSIAPTEGRRAGPEQATHVIARLLERVKARPDDADGWTLLGRAYVSLQRYRDGAIALQRAVDLAPGNANLIADLADVTAMLQGRRFAGEPTRLIQRALDADPKHLKSLALAGTAAFEVQDYAAARDHWQRALALLPADAPAARSLRGSLAEAAKLAGEPSVPAAAGEAARIAGEVVLSPALASRLNPGDTLFVFARAAEGPRMPLAIVKRSAVLPATFSLDDSMAMGPQLRLSSYPRVVVGARLSRSGHAAPQAGDLVGQSEPVAPGATGLRIVIDRVQP